MDQKIFISYSRKDKKKVFAIKDEIEQHIGKGSCWIDLTGIESDEQFIDVIISAIDNTEIFVFMYSVNSAQSEWSRKELMYASKHRKKVVFVNIDGSKLDNWFDFQFSEHNIINYSNSDQRNLMINNLRSWCCCSGDTSEQHIHPTPLSKRMKIIGGCVILIAIATILFFIVPTVASKNKYVLQLQPYNNFTQAEANQLKLDLETQLVPVMRDAGKQLTIEVLPNETLPRQYYSPLRGRYRADSIIHHLESLKKPSVHRMGLTHYVLCTTKNGVQDYAVFGLSYTPGHSSVVSTERLDNQKRSLCEIASLQYLLATGINRCNRNDPNCLLSSQDGVKHGLCQDCKKRLANQKIK